MKYTKTVPYFKKGKTVKKRVEVGNTGKTKEEIMAEARRNQAIEKKDQAVDAEKAKTANNVSKPKKDLSGTSSKAKPYSGNISKPNKYLSGISSKAKTASIVAPVGRTVAKTKDQAFQEARERGDSEFIWEGNPYHTRTAEEEAKRKEETPVPEQITNEEQHAIDVNRLPNISRLKSLGWDWFGWNPGTRSVDTGWTKGSRERPVLMNRFVTRDGKDVSYLATSENINKPFDARIILRGDTIYTKGLNSQVFADGDEKIWESRGYQQGGTINKFQRGTQGSGITRADLPTTSKWNIFGFQPDAAKWFPTDRDLPKGQTEEVSRWMHRNKDITKLRRPRPYYTADQPSMYNSTRTINWDNEVPTDTTYTYGNKVIQPNTIDYERYKAAFAGGDRALLQNIGKHQQGGQVEQQPQITEEDLIMDFTVRYLSALGVSPEEIMDQEGSLNPAYVEEITNVFQQGDIDWESYMASPDEYIQQFVGSRMQMARKGAKLKRLSQIRIYKK